jgi:hypothetical protein
MAFLLSFIDARVPSKKAETPLFDNISGQPKRADRCLSLFRGLNLLAIWVEFTPSESLRYP